MSSGAGNAAPEIPGFRPVAAAAAGIQSGVWLHPAIRQYGILLSSDPHPPIRRYGIRLSGNTAAGHSMIVSLFTTVLFFHFPVI